MQERALNILVGQHKQCIDVTHSPPNREKKNLSPCFEVYIESSTHPASQELHTFTYKLPEIVEERSDNQSDKKSTDITHKQIENTQKKSVVAVLHLFLTKDSVSLL